MHPLKQRIDAAVIYLVTTSDPMHGWDELIPRVLDAGVGVVQLREKNMEAGEILRNCEFLRAATERAGALFIVNDRVDVAIAAGADGVHLGQNDIPITAARSQVGSEMLIGLSTHTEREVIDAQESEADYIGVGPVYSTPTKLGRKATGLDLVRFAAVRSAVPFFAIGGIDETTIDDVVQAGAKRVSVLRAITESSDPVAATKNLMRRLR